MPAASTTASAAAPDSGYLDLIKQTANEWMEDKAPKLAAALAYYTIISLAPLLIITVLILGFFLRQEAAQGQVAAQVESLTGHVGADAVEGIIQTAGERKGATMWGLLFGFAILVFGASGVFGELQDSMNTIWDVKPKGDRGVWGWIKDRFFSMAMVLGVAFLLLVSLFVSTAIAGVSGAVVGRMFGDGTIAKAIGFIIDLAVSTAVITVLFAAIFRMLPDVKIGWRDVWLGALTTAVLFQVGKYLLGWYLSKGGATSNFGAAGAAAESLIALLIWVYYSAQILFFGAEFTQVYARAHGQGLQPTENARPITEKERATQGIPSDRTGGTPMTPRIPPVRSGEFRPLPVASQAYNFHTRRPTNYTATYVAAGAGLVAGLVGGAYAAITKKGSPRQMNLELLGNRLHRIEAEAGRIAALNKRVEKVGVVDRVNRLEEHIDRAVRNAGRREHRAHSDWRSRIKEMIGSA